MILTMVAMLMMTTAFAENENTTEVSNLVEAPIATLLLSAPSIPT